MSVSNTLVDRRNFLKTGLVGATGLVVGFYLPTRTEARAAARGVEAAAPSVLNAWVHIGTDDNVTLLISKSEMGKALRPRLPCSSPKSSSAIGRG